MRGLIRKSLYEVWLPTLLFGCGLFGVMGLLTHILPQIYEGLAHIVDQIPFIRPVLTALLGVKVDEEITAQTMQAFLWVHPLVLALTWGHEITLCTRLPAGEIDRGTVDFLFGLPVSRFGAYVCESIVWLATGVLVVLAGYMGHRLATPGLPPEMWPAFSRAALVMINMYCVYVAVGGIALLVSALSDRRGRAVGIVFGIAMASFLLNFLAQFWEPAKNFAFLGVMQYYRPAQIIHSGQTPWQDMGVLLAVGATAWVLGAIAFSRRSICTV